MRYAVIYQSKSGNTRRVAEAIYESLASNDKKIFNLDEISAMPEADVYFVGLCVHNSRCGIRVIDCLEHISKGAYALFATCGLSPTEQYKYVLERNLEVWLPENAEYLGMFLCQGRTEKEQQDIIINQYSGNSAALKKIFQFGELHPDEKDLQRAADFARAIQKQLEYGN